QTRRPDIAVGNFLIGGRHVLASTWYTWNASVARSRLNNVAPGTASFSSTLDTSTCQFSPNATTNTYQPQFTPDCFAEAYNPANMALSRISIDYGHSAQLNLSGDGAMGKRYHLGSHLGTIEFGGKFRSAHKFDDTYSVRLTPTTNIMLSQFPNRISDDNYYGGAYKLGLNAAYQDIIPFAN